MTLSPPPVMATPDDVLKLEDQGLYELVDGQLVEKRMSSLATKTAARICRFLSEYLDKIAGGGEVYAEQTFMCFPEAPDLIRRPDIAVVVGNRVDEVEEEGHVTIAPDIAIEVVSPNDLAYELDEKRQEYLTAGVKLVWQINPKARLVHVHRLDGTAAVVNGNEILSGETVLPGFAVKVNDLAPAPRKKK